MAAILAGSRPSIIVYSDNQGVIGSFDKSHSHSFLMNLAIQYCSIVLVKKNIHLSLLYVASATNPTDPISHGDLVSNYSGSI